MCIVYKWINVSNNCIFLIRAPKTAGNFAGDFAEVAFWVLKSRCPEGGNLNVEQVNKHLDNIALKHATHDPSMILIFVKKEMWTFTSYEDDCPLGWCAMHSVEVQRCSLIALLVEAASTSETLVSIY